MAEGVGYGNELEAASIPMKFNLRAGFEYVHKMKKPVKLGVILALAAVSVYVASFVFTVSMVYAVEHIIP